MRKKHVALITGITGQDGSYLAEFLLEKGYEVHGIIRRSSSINTGRIDHIFSDLHLHYGDVTDSLSLISLIKQVRPTEIYNLAAQSHVKVSFEVPEYTGMVDGLGTLKVLEAVRALGMEKEVRIYQASTSELFGLVQETPQKETTPFYPRSPYGVAKLYAYWIVKNYRESYGMYACSGILFNHESPRRGATFVTKKIVDGLCQYHQNKSPIVLGNVLSMRDWGHAKDYVRAMWLMLQQNYPKDFVIATGQQYSVKQFVDACCTYFDIDAVWKTGLRHDMIQRELDNGENVFCIDNKDRSPLVMIDRKYFRPAEVESLLGDSSLAQKELGWKQEYSFDDLVREMCEEAMRKK